MLSGGESHPPVAETGEQEIDQLECRIGKYAGIIEEYKAWFILAAPIAVFSLWIRQ
jgi:hypothetical protein